jgi:hypothetical protein
VKRVILHSRAAAEIEEAVEYYNAARDGLGDEFRDEIEARVDLIGRQPKAFSPYPGGYRKCVLGARFPYTIFYKNMTTTCGSRRCITPVVNQMLGKVERPSDPRHGFDVLIWPACSHMFAHHKRPGYWKRRLRPT